MDDVGALMAAHDPAPAELRPDELLLAEILATARPRRPVPRWRMGVGAVLATGLVIVAANAVPSQESDGALTVAATLDYAGSAVALCGEPGPRPSRLPGPGGSARPGLLALAGRAVATPLPATGSNLITVVQSRLLTDDGGSRMRTSLVRLRTPVSGQGVRQRTEFPMNGQGGLLVQGQGRAEATPYQSGLVAGRLPTRAGALRTRLLGAGQARGRPETARLVGAVVELNENEVVGGRVAGAIWRLLAGRADLRALGRVTDRRGRAGQGFAFDAGESERWVLVADAATGALLSVERVVLADTGGLEVTPPCVRDFWVFVAREWRP
ncbi:hypothetical protein OIE66_10420 [Nonomuraea sp. NBC_01738]|uniref:hypothetical protein n=1 Tax=Nonomuraea sp. NBC_01738 TaxID=2976003 RepID=UPI002E147398|nr:hypothetical protein OIE66_10420 [Nonomuraea sp. NBC_01738]